MADCSVLRPREKPIGKTTHRWPSVPKTRTRTQGETHIEEAALRAASTKGGGRLQRPPPFVDSSIWVSPWVWVRVFRTPGQVLRIYRRAMRRFAYGFLHGSEHRALSHVSAFLWVSPGYEPSL